MTLVDSMFEKIGIKRRIPESVEKAVREIRNGHEPGAETGFAIPDGVRPVEINVDEAGWKNHPDVPTYDAPRDQKVVEEYVVDLHSFGSPLDPSSRMEWMRQLQAKIPPPDDDYESRSVGVGIDSRTGEPTAHLEGGPLRE